MTTHNDIEAGNKLTIRVLPTREWPDDRITIQIRSKDQVVTVRNGGARNKARPAPSDHWRGSIPVGRSDALHQILEGFLDRLLAIKAAVGAARVRSSGQPDTIHAAVVAGECLYSSHSRQTHCSSLRYLRLYSS